MVIFVFVLGCLMRVLVFLDINKNSPPPYSLTVDIMKELDKIENKSYDCDFDFHADLRAAIAKYVSMVGFSFLILIFYFFRERDVHSGYHLPRGYLSYWRVQPLHLVSKIEGGEQQLYVKSDISAGLHDYIFPEKDSISGKYLGWKVVEIEGEVAMDYLIRYADENGRSKDPGINFNIALFHSFKYRFCSFFFYLFVF